MVEAELCITDDDDDDDEKAFLIYIEHNTSKCLVTGLDLSGFYCILL